MVSPELLRRYPYFTAAGEGALKQVAMMAQQIDLALGEGLFREGERADKLYLLTQGEVALQLAVASGRHVNVETRVAGDLLGWSATSAPAPTRRRAGCVALKPCTLIAIDGPGLQSLCDEKPELGYHLMREVVRALTERLDGAWSQIAASETDIGGSAEPSD